MSFMDLVRLVGFIYVDDSIVVTRPGTTESCEALLDMLYDMCGFVVSHGKSDSQLVSPETMLILGLLYRRK